MPCLSYYIDIDQRSTHQPILWTVTEDLGFQLLCLWIRAKTWATCAVQPTQKDIEADRLEFSSFL